MAAERKSDRRVKYTIMILKDALVQLMQTEHISSISVKSLCELADVNRSTFYSHFKDQYDLLGSIEREVLDKIKEDLKKQDFKANRPVSLQVLTRILEYVEENADLFRALLSDNCDPLFQREIMNIADVLPLERQEDVDERTMEYMTIFGITGCVSVLQKWLQDGTPEPPTKIAELVMQILYRGAAGFTIAQSLAD